jgi:carboxypeptidase Taq
MKDTRASLTPGYDALTLAHLKQHRFQHLLSMMHWDQAVNMPAAASEARAAALTELEALLHRLRTDAEIGLQLDRATTEPLDAAQAANLREMRRLRHAAAAWPEALVARRSLAASRCEHAWRTQRPANDWVGFLPNFKAVLANAREEAQRLGDHLGVAPYDALLGLYEPEMRAEEVSRVFDPLRAWLPGLIREVVERQATETLLPLQGPFPIPRQRWLCEQVMGTLGFDFASGRLDVSTHPFSGGSPEDVRLTTRFNEGDFMASLMGTVHETGHGRYEQNLPRGALGQPVAVARSMAIHESQSLAFEMQLGAHPGFARMLSPLLVEAFGPQAAFEPGNLVKHMTRVQPSLIRVEADEVTYPAHVILRFDIERALIEGRAEAEDVPALWDDAMQNLLGLDTRGNYRDGPLQDVHWPSGLFGYFPCYSLGAMYAAQWFAALRRDHADLDDRLLAGDFMPVFDWLRERIWSQGSRWSTEELAIRASGEPLNPAHFESHLRGRYLPTDR